jgi:hypothetical protein
MVTMTDWHPVTNAAGDVLGFMAAPDPDEDPGGDYFTDDRRRVVWLRAGVIGQAADMFHDHAFDPAETWDAGLAYGLSDRQLDAAAYVAVTLEEIELDVG